MTRPLPLEKTYTHESIKTGQPVVGTFATAPYASEGLGNAEEGVYQAQGLVAQPLGQIGDTLVSAGYPTELRGEIEHRLAAARNRFSSLLEDHAGTIANHVSHVQAIASGVKRDESTSWIDALELKPNFMGIGVNFNAVLAKLIKPKPPG